MNKLYRCPWAKDNNLEYQAYHDQEWGVSVYDDRTLFEFLILEGAQAGLSWETVLRKRASYKKTFCNFNPQKVANLSDQYLTLQLNNQGIIRNRLKIFSVRQNALAFLKIQKEFGSFSSYLWAFVDNKKIINSWAKMSEIPVSSQVSLAISKDLKKRDMNFVGPTIIYAYLQAIGLVNDHLISCHCYKKCCKE